MQTIIGSEPYAGSLMNTSLLTPHQPDATTIYLASYHIFAKETLKPTSATMVEFRNKRNKLPCERCSKINEPCVAPEEGRGGVRCTFCSRRRLVCSWRADILIPASTLHYDITNEEAHQLYERWSGECAQNKTNIGNSKAQSMTPSVLSARESSARHTVAEMDAQISTTSLPNVPFIQFLEPLSYTPLPMNPQTPVQFDVNDYEQPAVMAGPPSLARKANKLRNTFMDPAPPPAQFIEHVEPNPSAPVQPASRPRGRPRKYPVKVEDPDLDDAEILRPKRTAKPTPKIQLATGSKQLKESKNKRKQSDTDLQAASASEPSKKRGRASKTTKVSITIPARSSKRLKKGVSTEPIPQPSPKLATAATTTPSLLANLPEDVGERYHALETRYIKLCDIHAQNAIELQARDIRIRELEEEAVSLRKRLELIEGDRS